MTSVKTTKNQRRKTEKGAFLDQFYISTYLRLRRKHPLRIVPLRSQGGPVECFASPRQKQTAWPIFLALLMPSLLRKLDRLYFSLGLMGRFPLQLSASLIRSLYIDLFRWLPFQWCVLPCLGGAMLQTARYPKSTHQVLVFGSSKKSPSSIHGVIDVLVLVLVVVPFHTYSTYVQIPCGMKYTYIHVYDQCTYVCMYQWRAWNLTTTFFNLTD